MDGTRCEALGNVLRRNPFISSLVSCRSNRSVTQADAPGWFPAPSVAEFRTIAFPLIIGSALCCGLDPSREVGRVVEVALRRQIIPPRMRPYRWRGLQPRAPFRGICSVQSSLSSLSRRLASNCSAYQSKKAVVLSYFVSVPYGIGCLISCSR